MKMRKSFCLIAAAVAAFTGLGALIPAQARADVSVNFFYDNLDPYGEWVQTPDYGYCWHPTGVDENWAPYTDGYWAYTDDGWTWVSYEDYGGIVYHYGRWAHMHDEGWVWVPGETWAPAWVSWRSNDDYVGWAPLPPEAHWRGGFGFGRGVDASFDIGPGFYSFVGVRDFGAPALGPVILNREQNVTIINNTTNITNITTINNSNVYVGGPSYAKVAARSARPIPTLKIVRQSDPGAIRAQGGKFLSHQQGNQLMVLSPKITAPAAGSHLVPSKIAKTLTASKADHGWDVVKDPDQREKLRSQVKSQAGSESAGAKPVNPDDIKFVNEKIKTQAVTKPFAAGEGTTPAPKGKKGSKNATPSPDYLNAPATESTAGASPAPSAGKGKKGKKGAAPLESFTPGGTETGVATEGVTPVPKKGKKGKPVSEAVAPTGAGADAYTEATPIPKKGKGKKAPTPAADYGYGTDVTPKVSKPKNPDANLQPFNGGGGSSDYVKPEKKAKKPSDFESGPNPNVSRSYEERPAANGGGNPGGKPQFTAQPKGEKGEKGDKGKKGKGDQTPAPGQ